MPNAQQNNNIVIMVEISIIINHNYCYCPLLRCRVWQSTTGSSSANIGCSRKLVSFFKLELCSKNIFSHLCSHQFVQVRKYFLESCSEKYFFTVVFSRGSLELLRLLEGHEYGGQVVLVDDLELEVVSEKKILEHHDHEPE